jgi:putative membrane protein
MATAPLDATALAAERTRLSLERTLMAWIRTAVSLISFGFTIYKFFQLLEESRQPRVAEHLLGPQHFGGLMIVVGLVALTLAWIQHQQQLKTLRAQFGPLPYSLAGVVAVFVATLGVVALYGVAVRI